ncbi:MAG: polysaccharide deacetylase family protein [Nitrosopumilaceae archaeon]
MSFPIHRYGFPKIMFAILATSLLMSGMAQQFVVAQTTQTAKQSICNCVIFRLDDAQDYWIHSVQIQIMNLFISKDQSLSVGIIMNKTGSDQLILQEIREGQKKGLFELDIHGLNHVDYTTLSELEQKKTLDLANNKMQTLFDVRSNVFIPPYDRFNNSTLLAMTDSGIRILSASTSPPNDNRFIWNPTISYEPYSIYQFPETVGFMYEDKNGIWQKVSNSDILSSVDESIAEKGYAVVLLHPQNFAKMENGQFVDIIDENQINNLSSLIDSIRAKNIRITTFENIVGSTPPSNNGQLTANFVNERNEILKQQKTKIHDMIHECHLEMKNTLSGHKQIAHDCKEKIKKLREDYKGLQEQLKLESK